MIGTHLLERYFDALCILFDSDNGRTVVDLVGQPRRESFGEQVCTAPDLVVSRNLLMDRLVAQHDQRRPSFGPIVDTSNAHQGDGLGRCPPAAPKVGSV